MGVALFSFESSGSFKKTDNFLQRMLKGDMFSSLEQFAREGVDALSSATPVDSGLTAGSWNYEIRKSRGFYQIIWTNSNVVDGRPIAILLQYGHGTGTGGYVEGYDYINPAMRPVFDRLAENVWKAVTSA